MGKSIGKPVVDPCDVMDSDLEDVLHCQYGKGVCQIHHGLSIGRALGHDVHDK